MERINDTMTICTLAKPNIVTITPGELKEAARLQEHYEMLINTLNQAISLDIHGDPDIDFRGRDLILLVYKLIEPDAYNYRLRQLKTERGEVDS